MRTTHLLTLLLVGLASACAEAPTSPLAPADPSLIISGEPDDGRHPYVGLLYFYDADGAWTCSGTLLSESVVLTAAHCTNGAAGAFFWPAETPWPTSPTLVGSYPGTAYTYEEYGIRPVTPAVPGWIHGDIGVVVLSIPVPTSVVAEYGQLPEIGYVDALAHKTRVGLVGYGVENQIHGGGQPVWEGTYQRLYTEAELFGGSFVNRENVLRLTGNFAQGKGTTCFGDSGGPNLIGTTVIGVTSYGIEGNCRSVWYSSRIDTPGVHEWISSFLE